MIYSGFWIFNDNIPVLENYFPWFVQLFFFFLVIQVLQFSVLLFYVRKGKPGSEPSKPDKVKRVKKSTPKKKKRGRPKGSKNKNTKVNPLHIEEKPVPIEKRIKDVSELTQMEN